MAINNCSAFEAIQSLNENIPFSFCPGKVYKKGNSVNIRKVQAIRHPALIEYLHLRKIPLEVARRFCHEVWYSLNKKVYFSIGLKNDAGGWELRNKFFKCSTTKKTPTSYYNWCSRLLIIEGMFDFLSLKVLDDELFCTSDAIVLNSLGNIKFIPEDVKDYAEIYLLLDNDNAGRTATKNLLQMFPNAQDESEFYFDFKDLNNMLTHGRKEK